MENHNFLSNFLINYEDNYNINSITSSNSSYLEFRLKAFTNKNANFQNLCLLKSFCSPKIFFYNFLCGGIQMTPFGRMHTIFTLLRI